MAKLFSVLFIFLFAFVSFAQDSEITTSIDAKQPANNGGSPDVVLWDQTGTVTAATIANQQFGDFPGFSCQAADDFVVTSGFIWTIETVTCLGSFSATGGFTTALVEFYQDNAGEPDTVTGVISQVANVTDVGGTVVATLAPSVVLPNGTYWVSVSVIGDFAVVGQWYQFLSSGANGAIWHWRNPGGGFVTNAFSYLPHSSITGIGPYVDNDLAFILDGTEQIIPVELTSFTATAGINEVVLNWTTATEVNNSGFEVQRSVNGEFNTIGFVAGHGTTTEIQNYSYTDNSVEVGSYSYRLKQIDHDGTFEYSNVVEVDVLAPAEFSLAQNYPNPFNPSTQIDFSLAVDSKVSMTVYSLLGEAVTTLVNNSFSAGTHSVNFDASSLNSGVYFYKIDAQGINGENFTQVRKMMLTK